MFKVSNTFIGNFKIGDNIHYNLDVLRALYSSRALLPVGQKSFLEKPITVILVSICEALIYDFIGRSKLFIREGIDGLSGEDLEKLRNRNSYNMDKKIKLIEELDLLQASEPRVYEYLRKLVSLRNRIHIQNENQNLEIDERDAFTLPRRVEAEKMLELLMKRLGALYPRPLHIVMSQYVDDFELPWTAHFNI
jgi:hypothetical protein